MSESPVLGSMNCAADSEDHPRPVLGPAGNLAARSVAELRKPKTKMDHHKPLQQQQQQVKKSPPSLAVTTAPPLHSHSVSAPSILRRQRSHKGLLTSSNLSMNASCSSDASSDSSHSRVSSTGKISSRRNYVRTAATTATAAIRRKQCSSRSGRIENVAAAAAESDTSSDFSADALLVRKRCAWVTPNTDPCYAAFHDEEWGVPVHDDKKLFELLSLSTALAELSWPTILNKRVMFREAFHDFDPMVVSKLNEKKIAAPGSLASSLLSELKLRGFIENARQMCKIIEEFGSFDKYIWGFVNHKPTVSQFRYPRQVPIKTSKADAISKDLVRRGFRGVGPTVIYSFMQVAGITNDHLVSCFRFQACTAAGDATDNGDEKKAEGKQLLEDANGLGLASVIDDLSLTAK